MTRDWLRSRGNTIEGGTTEVQLNIIAKRVLGLPGLTAEHGSSFVTEEQETARAHGARVRRRGARR